MATPRFSKSQSPPPKARREQRARSAAFGFTLLLAGVVSGPVSRAAAQAPEASELPKLVILDDNLFFGCRRVEGTFMALVKPGLGALVLSAGEFQGSEAVGVAQGESLAFSVPGTRMPEIQARSARALPERTPISGRLYRNLELPEEALCIGFDRRDFPPASGLEPFLQRVIDDVARNLPAGSLEDRSFFLSDRSIELEIAVGDAPPVPFSAEEGTPTPVTLPGIGTPTVILALVAPSDEPAVFVRITGSDAFTSGSSSFTRVGGRLVAVGAADPPIKLRLGGIGSRPPAGI